LNSFAPIAVKTVEHFGFVLSLAL